MSNDVRLGEHRVKLKPKRDMGHRRNFLYQNYKTQTPFNGVFELLAQRTCVHLKACRDQGP